MSKIDIKSMNYEMLCKEIEKFKVPKFVAKQIYEWIHKKLIRNFEEMTNISKNFRKVLEDNYEISLLEPVEIRESQIDATRKYLFAFKDGNIVESVLMRYKHGNSICVSSQVGCRMGCKFCASTLEGRVRNLTAGEILDQIYYIQRQIGERISNVVVMGAGEPFDNYDNLIHFIKILCGNEGLNISQRNITVSTCGIVPKMLQFADEGLQVTLALSLHASNDKIRQSLMPIANKYALKEVLEACTNYYNKTGRRVTLEYSLVKNVNDNKEEAFALVRLVSGMHTHVNLIPVNPIKERDYIQSDNKDIIEFKNILEKNKINVTIRREMGRDIDGACGQLRKSYIENKSNEREKMDD
jgi:23S rRNA m2A2503 methyltransferase